MQLTITLAQLKSAGACSEAVALFQSCYGDSAAEDWTREKQIELLKGPLGKYLGWAVHTKLIPWWSMSGADLSRADLSGADLSGADLSGADLSRADLSWADLSRADLSWADLSGAYLSGAYLSGADLFGADLSGADLSGAYLFGADLSRADLSWADLFGWQVDANGIVSRKVAVVAAGEVT